IKWPEDLSTKLKTGLVKCPEDRFMSTPFYVQKKKGVIEPISTACLIR
uniref:Uncharacterized protein n=1 Tax=Aegilops tauschii subsp. strangulata TaxID=200361 RepID=A0A452Z4E4_AEGTS